MAETINISDLYTSIASSLDEANRLLDESAEDAEFSYAVTELDVSVPFKELIVEEGRVGIALANGNDEVSDARSLRFSVRFVPRTTKVKEIEEPEPEPEPEVIVPDLLKLSLKSANAKIKESGLELGKVSYDPAKRPAGRVVSQTPEPLTRVRSGSKIDLVVSGVVIKPKKG